MKKVRNWKRVVYLCLAALYLAVAAAFTVRAQVRHHEALPLVKLTAIHDGLVDAEWLTQSDATRKLALNTVEQRDGPWGKRYYIKQVDLVNFVSVGSRETYYIFGASKITAPIVVWTDGILSDGAEVRLE